MALTCLSSTACRRASLRSSTIVSPSEPLTELEMMPRMAICTILSVAEPAGPTSVSSSNSGTRSASILEPEIFALAVFEPSSARLSSTLRPSRINVVTKRQPEERRVVLIEGWLGQDGFRSGNLEENQHPHKRVNAPAFLWSKGWPEEGSV